MSVGRCWAVHVRALALAHATPASDAPDTSHEYELSFQAQPFTVGSLGLYDCFPLIASFIVHPAYVSRKYLRRRSTWARNINGFKKQIGSLRSFFYLFLVGFQDSLEISLET